MRHRGRVTNAVIDTYDVVAGGGGAVFESEVGFATDSGTEGGAGEVVLLRRTAIG